MRCIKCPLCAEEGGCSDEGSRCLITGEYVDEETSCCRTNKYILAQDVDKLKEKQAEEESRIWGDFTDWLVDRETKAAKYRR